MFDSPLRPTRKQIVIGALCLLSLSLFLTIWTPWSSPTSSPTSSLTLSRSKPNALPTPTSPASTVPATTSTVTEPPLATTTIPTSPTPTTQPPPPTTTQPPVAAPTVATPPVTTTPVGTSDLYAAWTKVAICEEGGWGHYGFPAYPNSLGITTANWYGNGGGSDLSPSAQIAVAQRVVARYATPGWIPDQNGCSAW